MLQEVERNPGIASIQHAGFQAKVAQAFADLEAVASGLQQDDVLRGQLGGSPFQESLHREVFAGSDLARVVRCLAHEDRCGEGVRIRACCKHSRVPPRTIDQSFRFTQRWLLHDFMPSRIWRML